MRHPPRAAARRRMRRVSDLDELESQNFAARGAARSRPSDLSDRCEPPQAPELEIGADVLTPAEGLGNLLAYVERAFRLDDLGRLAR